MSSGPIDSKEAFKKAKAFGISDKSLRTTRNRLKVKPQKVGYGANGRWVWELPTDEDAHVGIKGALDAHTLGEGALGIFDNKGHLNKGNSAVADDAEGFHRTGTNLRRLVYTSRICPVCPNTFLSPPSVCAFARIALN